LNDDSLVVVVVVFDADEFHKCFINSHHVFGVDFTIISIRFIDTTITTNTIVVIIIVQVNINENSIE
jgi:hypothetical protein